MRILPAILILLAATPSPAAIEVRLTVWFQRKPSGRQLTQVADDGPITVDNS
jgi:hypothetical protein